MNYYKLDYYDTRHQPFPMFIGYLFSLNARQYFLFQLQSSILLPVAIGILNKKVSKILSFIKFNGNKNIEIITVYSLLMYCCTEFIMCDSFLPSNINILRM